MKLTIEVTDEQYAALVCLQNEALDEDTRSDIVIDIADDIIELCVEATIL